MMLLIESFTVIKPECFRFHLQTLGVACSEFPTAYSDKNDIEKYITKNKTKILSKTKINKTENTTSLTKTNTETKIE